MADEITESQVAPADTGTTETGTAEQATDVSAPADAPQGATPPDGTVEDTTSTTASAEAAPETPEAKSRRERQRDARKQATPPAPPQPTPAEIIAAYERQREAEQREAERVRQEHRRRAEYLGEVPSDPRDPNSPTVYQHLQTEANTAIPDGDDTYYTEETRALVRRVNAARARLAEYDGRRGLIQAEAQPLQHAARNEALNWIGTQFERALAAESLDLQAILGAGASVPPDERMPAIVKKLAAEVRAPLAERIGELEEQHTADQAEIDGLKRRLGGNAPGGMHGGQVGGGAPGGPLTLERYSAMSTEERLKLRSTSEGRAAIDAMTQGRNVA